MTTAQLVKYILLIGPIYGMDRRSDGDHRAKDRAFLEETVGLPLRVTRDLQFRKTILEQVADITAERDALWQRLALLARPSRPTPPDQPAV
ncbi:hypothetical protein [Bradyrhizobium murdochi]|uniref:hypothetical protein n=1 Tax=Bradyrhizobium murdochi TaxID=1038859 RepID=UPI00048643E4|nr:hypothetical protein [Bradyrhizobium murdochi]